MILRLFYGFDTPNYIRRFGEELKRPSNPRQRRGGEERLRTLSGSEYMPPIERFTKTLPEKQLQLHNHP